MNATVTPATVADTLAPATPATLATLADMLADSVTALAPADGLPTADALADALAAVSVARDGDDTARATLADITRARYVFHASRYAHDRAGVAVLPDTLKSDVAARMWMDATGSRKSPATADRTGGERSFAQYVSRSATVATDIVYGLAGLADAATARESYTAILADRKQEREDGDRAVARVAHTEYVAWRDALPTRDRDALARVVALMTETSVGRDHTPAFVAVLSA